jgi:hypothetical protein
MRSDEPASLPPVATTFEVWGHRVALARIAGPKGRWSVAVDDAPLAASYTTHAEAWEAGVREAYRTEKLLSG